MLVRASCVSYRANPSAIDAHTTAGAQIERMCACVRVCPIACGRRSETSPSLVVVDAIYKSPSRVEGSGGDGDGPALPTELGERFTQSKFNECCATVRPDWADRTAAAAGQCATDCMRMPARRRCSCTHARTHAHMQHLQRERLSAPARQAGFHRSDR